MSQRTFLRARPNEGQPSEIEDVIRVDDIPSDYRDRSYEEVSLVSVAADAGPPEVLEVDSAALTIPEGSGRHLAKIVIDDDGGLDALFVVVPIAGRLTGDTVHLAISLDTNSPITVTLRDDAGEPNDVIELTFSTVNDLVDLVLVFTGTTWEVFGQITQFTGS